MVWRCVCVCAFIRGTRCNRLFSLNDCFRETGCCGFSTDFYLIWYNSFRLLFNVAKINFAMWNISLAFRNILSKRVQAREISTRAHGFEKIISAHCRFYSLVHEQIRLSQLDFFFILPLSHSFSPSPDRKWDLSFIRCTFLTVLGSGCMRDEWCWYTLDAAHILTVHRATIGFIACKLQTVQCTVHTSHTEHNMQKWIKNLQMQSSKATNKNGTHRHWYMRVQCAYSQPNRKGYCLTYLFDAAVKTSNFNFRWAKKTKKTIRSFEKCTHTRLSRERAHIESIAKVYTASMQMQCNTAQCTLHKVSARKLLFALPQANHWT